MRIGIPKETKDHEFRVAVTPAGVAELVRAGHEVSVQAGAGVAVGFEDDAYRSAGALLAGGPEELYAADLICKVKEPQPGELPLLRPEQILFCFLHLAAMPRLARALLDAGVTAIGFETVEDGAGRTPLLAPMSQIAGRLAVQAGMVGLEMRHGGRGVLLAGVPGVLPGRVVILGGGQVGMNAARIATGLGAEVTLMDVSLERLQALDERHGGRVRTLFSNQANLEASLQEADVVIGAVYIHGRRAPRLIDRTLLRRMPRGSVLVDVAVDQGGIAETSRPTTHTDPFYVEEGVVHYGVSNMPGVVARTSTLALAQATLPYLLRLAQLGPAGAFGADPGFAAGLNIAGGQVRHPGLARDLGLAYRPWNG